MCACAGCLAGRRLSAGRALDRDDHIVGAVFFNDKAHRVGDFQSVENGRIAHAKGDCANAAHENSASAAAAATAPRAFCMLCFIGCFLVFV